MNPSERPGRAATQAEVDALVSRLNAGLAKIEAGRVAGEDVTYWEDFWCELLRRYERTYDALQALGGG